MEMRKSDFIVGDAGGTKTEWRAYLDGEIHQFNSHGFNAYTHDLGDFKANISQNLSEVLGKDIPAYLYAAGVDTQEQKEQAEKELGDLFKHRLTIENDLLGAAKSLCGDKSGNVCILGTGSNACHYNGVSVNKVSASLGYVLGDEGSGAYLGKKLLKLIFREQVSTEISSSFQDQFKLNSHIAIQKIYNEPKPNHFLASFATFIHSNQHHPEIYQLIYDSFSEFFQAFLSKSGYAKEECYFSGSIAHYFSNILRQVGVDKGFSIRNIVESPISGLVLYHQEHG
jgi:N-acetylglucosamine kinase-like BadF-type ATPase